MQDAYPPLNSFQALFYLEAAVTAIGTLYLAISQRQAKNYDKYEDEEEQERREAAQKELSRLVDAAKAENQLEFVKGLQAQAKSMQSLAEHLGDELVYVKRRQRQGMAIQCGSVALMLALLVGFFFYQMQTADAIHTVASLQAPAAATTVASVAPAKPVLPVSEIHSKPHMKAVVKNTTHKKPKLKPHSVPYEPPMDVAAPASDTVANTNNPT